jgi:exopolysaccharide biosynthesis polyprenyl glycosylphosphotransferase
MSRRLERSAVAGGPGDVVRVSASEGDVTLIRDVALEYDHLSANGTGTVPVRAGDVRRRRLVVAALATTDALSLVLAVGLSGIPVAEADMSLVHRSSLYLGLIALWLSNLAAFGLYSSGRTPLGEQAKRIVSAAGVGAALSIALLAGRLPFAGHNRLGVTLVLLIGAELATRTGWARFADVLRRQGKLRLRTVVIGTNEEPDDLAEVLRAQDSDLVPLGRVLVKGDPEARDGLRCLGDLGSLESVVRHEGPDCLLVATQSLRSPDLDPIRRIARREGLSLRVLARAPETLASRLTVMPVGSLVAVGVRPARLSGLQAALKRGLDVMVAALALIVASPVMLGVAVAVRMSSPGPILFRQARITKGGRSFTIFKFRTMVHEVDRIIAEQSLDRTQPFFKPLEVDLVTPVGAFLRKVSLDELPQLWNVVRGDMSLVGPRPLPAEQVAANPQLLGPRHDVRAGITGWWQVNGRSEVSPGEAVRKDLFYIENWSLWLDLSILLRTIGVLVHRRGAR